MKNQEMLGEESIGKLLLKYSLPAIIGMLVNALYNVVDRIFIGNIPDVGPLAITGVGVTMPIITILLAFGMLIGIGSTSNISIKLGQGKKEEATNVIGNAITLSVIVGITLTIIGVLFGDTILVKFGASESTLYYAKSYINIILIGAVFNLTAFSLNSTIRADGNPKLSATIMVVGCLTNIVLDALFIFGFNMGIHGAALATVISQILTAVLAIKYYVSGKSNLKFKKSGLKLSKKIVMGIFAIGLAPFTMQIAASLVQVIANNSLKAYGGDLAIGAMATISSASMIFLMPIFGLNQGSQPIIGYNYGAKKYKRAKDAWKLSAIASTVILALAAVITQVFPEVIIGMFNKDPELMAISVRGIRVYLLMIPLLGISITGSNYIQSIGKAKLAMFLSLLRQVILLIPMLLILPPIFGLDGIWAAQPVSDVIYTVIAVIVLVREMIHVRKLDANAKAA
ncbi:MATE family efflux transporter [Clostridium sp.]|uniref:MATE family efflux transporter n=1 Tax=Clostridium sp. TaxID=1506 RepID=UPI003F400D93